MPFIPFPDGFTPPDPPVYEPGEPGLSVLKQLTHWFILQDPSYIQLTPRDKVSSGNGAFALADQPPRPQQMVKMIFTAGSSDGISQAQDGQDREYDYIVVGEWNATIKANDYWIDPVTDQKYVVTGVSAYNGYEVKASIKSYGPEASYG
jgi:hypothetical protein